MNDPFLPEELRVFIALELPDAWKQALRRAERDLERAGLNDLRWVRPEGMHLTLKFLGEIGRHLLPDLQRAMQHACAAVPPMSLRLDGLGSFGGKGRVRVVWAGVGGDLDALRRLHASLDAAVAAIGFAREVRPYSPHLTLARLPDTAPPGTAGRVRTALAGVRLGEVEPYRAEVLSLIRSQLNRGGAVYTALATVPFSATEGATDLSQSPDEA